MRRTRTTRECPLTLAEPTFKCPREIAVERLGMADRCPTRSDQLDPERSFSWIGTIVRYLVTVASSCSDFCVGENIPSQTPYRSSAPILSARKSISTLTRRGRDRPATHTRCTGMGFGSNSASTISTAPESTRPRTCHIGARAMP